MWWMKSINIIKECFYTMKRIISAVLVAVMLVSLFAVTASAKDYYGTLVEASYTETAPNMEAMTYPDASWGSPIAHVTKNSPNAAITDYQYYHHNHDEAPYKCTDNLSFDMYARWTDDTLYLCFVSPDDFIRGAGIFTRGDGYQVVITYGIGDISLYNAGFGDTQQGFIDQYSYCITINIDDYSFDEDGASLNCDNDLFYDERTSTLVGKMAIPFTQLGMSKKATPQDGDLFSFSMIRIEGIEADPSGYTGWLEWGDFFNKDKGIPAPSGMEDTYYVPASMNTKTTSANTIKLVGKGGASAPATPETPATPAEKPSSWAEAEVTKAIEAGLVPADLQKNYTKGISRADLSKILSALIDKVYGKAADKSDASFTDTTDANVLKAANLGIINGYKQNDGSYLFKPENTLKRSEMSAIINRVAKLCGVTTTGFEAEVKFEDTASHWCNSELGWPVHTGIVKGTSATAFSPENTLTVEQTIMMVYRTFEALK